MKQNDFYEVNGCTEFIPVTINETFADGVGVTVHSATHPFRMMVKQVYRFLKQHEPQKVVVPKFVAEWIDTLDEHGLFGLNYDVVDESVQNWVYENYDCNAKKLHLAYLYGYEVEQEKLYTVEIAEAILTKITRGSNVQYKMLPFGNVSDVFDKAIYTTRLTEQEIKQQDERLWQWAKEVE
ncbi:DUF1642 domain-containing protein [Streptococcus suis]|uniref:DUF1642 domain-containing protein n=1 Tax=Streptococcus suis TaxID=1307 RepID=UPI0002B78631|nr:DUF1642 domain-containing protein [Streptococcus suis]AGF87452.1 hypothetical protein phi5218_0041 [Streptococcus phage phi5218]HEM2799295.1 DUF1642 domain-containing protein [Streptococcus suis]HEM3209175.1 DUF1642 domain-containing protein [Streptococcus suis 22083]